MQLACIFELAEIREIQRFDLIRRYTCQRIAGFKLAMATGFFRVIMFVVIVMLRVIIVAMFFMAMCVMILVVVMRAFDMQLGLSRAHGTTRRRWQCNHVGQITQYRQSCLNRRFIRIRLCRVFETHDICARRVQFDHQIRARHRDVQLTHTMFMSRQLARAFRHNRRGRDQREKRKRTQHSFSYSNLPPQRNCQHSIAPFGGLISYETGCYNISFIPATIQNRAEKLCAKPR